MFLPLHQSRFLFLCRARAVYSCVRVRVDIYFVGYTHTLTSIQPETNTRLCMACNHLTMVLWCEQTVNETQKEAHLRGMKVQVSSPPHHFVSRRCFSAILQKNSDGTTWNPGPESSKIRRVKICISSGARRRRA